MNIHQLYRPFLVHFRTRRMQKFWHRFNLTSDTSILDLGGGLFNWTLLPQKPKLTIVNIVTPQEIESQMHWIIADARQLPFKDATFDIVYSNSVIEHLGNYRQQELFATECARVGKRYYIQTPNKWFPVEPHLITLFIHWLPRKWQKHFLRYFTIWGWIARPTPEKCDMFVEEVRLLNKREMKILFPDADIWVEKFSGLTKSFIAVKT